MAEAKDDELILDIEDAPEIEVAGEEEPAVEKKIVEPDEGLDILKAKLEAESRARAEAERQAREARTAEYAARGEVRDSQLSLVTNAIETVKQNEAILKAAYRDAMSVGDYDRVADLQVEISNNSNRLMQLEQGKQALESQPKPELRQEAPRAPADPVEDLAGRLSPRSATWVRTHPECATDQKMFQRMIGAHNIALADGYVADSDAYFDAIERVMGFKETEEQPTPARKELRQVAPPMAPVSRSGGSSTPGKRTVTLTSEEHEIAKANGLTPAEYYAQKVRLQREGKYGATH